MSITGQKEIINFIETQLNTITNLDTVKVIDSNDEEIAVRKYGAFIYEDKENAFERDFPYIGMTVRDTWKINVDIIIRQSFKNQKDTYVSEFGTDYWIKTIQALFIHNTNNCTFDDCYWLHNAIIPVKNGITIKGQVTVIVENTY